MGGAIGPFEVPMEGMHPLMQGPKVVVVGVMLVLVLVLVVEVLVGVGVGVAAIISVSSRITFAEPASF